MQTLTRPKVTLQVEALEDRQLLSVSPLKLLSRETFDSTLTGALTSGWAQWSNHGSFNVSTNQGQGSRGLITEGSSRQSARAWFNTSQPANLQVSASVHLNSLVPVMLFARGADLSSHAPNYYAVKIERGLTVKLVRVVNGSETTLTQIRSQDYISNRWVRLTFRVREVTVAGQRRQLLEAMVQRTDTNEYLDNSGRWRKTAANALSVSDSSSAIRSAGQVGFARNDGYTGTVALDNVQVNALGSDGKLGAKTYEQNFNNIPGGELPSDWSQWDSEGQFQVASGDFVSRQNGLAANGGRLQEGRTWMDTPAPADVEVSAAVRLNSPASGQVLLRGTNLTSSAPSYYAARIRRGVEIELLRVQNGTVSVLARIRSTQYVSDPWIQLSLRAVGRTLQVRVQRLDTNQYLSRSGAWQTAETPALETTDSTITKGGLVGLARSGEQAGKVTFDNFSVSEASSTASTAPEPLSIRVQGVANNTTLLRNTAISVERAKGGPLQRVEFYIDNKRQATVTSAPFTWTLDPTKFSDGRHTLTVVGYDAAGSVARESLTITTRGSTTSPSGLPAIPRHYDHIRIAQLAYGGFEFTPFEEKLLRESVDLVIPSREYLNEIRQHAPNTPAMIYTNVSSLYLELLTDWLNWADRNGVSREAAFYHVKEATRFTGDSSSSQPVNWFWGIYQGGATPDFVNLTTSSRANSRSIRFGGVGTSMYIGYTEKFREINFHFGSGARNGWKAVLEYASEFNASGQPTKWKTLQTISDGTSGLTKNGRITFDPPADWKTGSIGGSDRLYYVRIRTTANGTAPVANTILGRDYVNANGGSRGTIPAFDQRADLNGDGYLSDSEYAKRASGKDARFLYESRLFQGVYGQMRPATNPSNAAFRQWAVDFHVRYLRQFPHAAGFFVDNSNGRAVLNNANVHESTSTFSNDYGTLLNAIGRAIAPKWILANTSGGGTDADGVVRQNTAYYEEFAIRALAHNYQQFEGMAALVEHRSNLKTPATLAVLDSLPTGGSPTDARTQIATLAYYYLLQDPQTTFLNFFGGFEPSTSWQRHWTDAVKFDVGQPLGTWSLFATDQDPADRDFTYRVYQRSYSNAMVLYKPLSYSRTGSRSGSLGNATMTTHQLDGVYRPLQADGRLGAPITSIRLRNGEGAILIRDTV